MSLLVVQMSAADVVRAFQRDIPYLFLGAIFVAVGAMSAALSGLRRKRDPLLLYFAIFAALYGIRLWIQSEVLQIAVQNSGFYPRLRFGLSYLVPVPAILFFRSAGLLNRAGKLAGNALIVISVALSLASVVFRPARIYEEVDSVAVIIAMLALVAQSASSATASSDFPIIRRGLLIFGAFVIWDNLRGVLQMSLLSVEPFGFAVFLGCLGYVAARQTLLRDQQLKEIQSELEIARRIQLSILPAEFPASPHFQVSARYLPMTSVAGDFYDYIIDGPQQAGLLVADVSGHGVPAALIASMVKMAAASQRDHASDPSMFLTRMNSVLCGNTQNQFVTAAYVHLNSAARELRYSAAGHPPMLLMRGGEVHQVEENGLMLAAFDFATYSNCTHPLQRGDRLLLYTDGVVEAANEAGDFFGIESLCEVLRNTEGQSPSTAADLIVGRVQQWSKIQEDDITLLVCDYVG
jgi:phosphoserine phosphatase RsbU/P